MKRPLDKMQASAEPGLPGAPLVPSLVAWSVLTDQVSPELAASVCARLAPMVGFQDVSVLSRRDKTVLRSLESVWVVSPILDGERFWLLLDSTLEGGVFVLSETGKVFAVLDSAVLLGFVLERSQVFSVFEIVFVYNPKAEDFVMVLQDALSLGSDAILTMRKVELSVFSQFCATRAKDLLPFDVLDQRYEALSGVGKLVSSIVWHEETSSRVWLNGEMRLAGSMFWSLCEFDCIILFFLI
jgi:hypothetical protein